MHEKPAILLEHVSKIYRLYGSQRAQLFDVLGLHRLGFAKPQAASEFKALDDISLSVPKGHRIGIIGRNGAGKTTLLKLICGNYTPTRGKIQVNGNVQALMNVGLGFHPEYTGMENLRASLQYNGLPKAEYTRAIEDILEFCELGAFIDQPFKTYSLGMQARLMFATATAIRPDILIIDEVLGAGDAYFIAKSKQRVERLVGSGATMLLVSHSTQQILELCQEAIWMHEGKIRMQGPSLEVVKAYEAYIYNPSLKHCDSRVNSLSGAGEGKANDQSYLALKAGAPIREIELPAEFKMQEPVFQPHSMQPSFPKLAADAPNTMQYQAIGGISRWESERCVKITGFTIQNMQGPANEIVALEPVAFVFHTCAEVNGPISCRYGVAIHDYLGHCVASVFSPVDHYDATIGEYRKITLMLNPNQLGPGEYTLGISISNDVALTHIHTAARYDLLSRSFSFRVILPESMNVISAAFFHSAEWNITPMEIAHDN